MENKNIFDKLIEKLYELELGEYNNKGINLKIVDNKQIEELYAIIKINIKEISISNGGIDRCINIQID